MSTALRFFSPLFLAAAAMAFVACKASVPPLEPHTAFELRSARYLAAIEASYRMENWAEHARLTAGLLREMNTLPAQTLARADVPLLRRLRTDGFGPHLSIVVDYAYRLRRHPTELTRGRYRWMWRQLRSTQSENSRRSTVLIRGPGVYRAYSENVGRALLPLLFSPLGDANMAQGVLPETLVRVATLATRCAEEADQVEAEGSASEEEEPRDPGLCSLYLSELEDGLEGSGGGPNALGEIASRIGEGVAGASRECVVGLSTDADAALVESMDALQGCLADQVATPATAGFDRFGNILPTSVTTPTLTDVLSDFEVSGPSEHAIFDDGSVLKQTPISSTTSNDTGQVLEDFDIGDDGEWIAKDKVVKITGPDGTVTRRFDGQGNQKSEKWEGAGDFEGQSFSKTTDEDGNVIIKIVDADGNEIDQVYDEDGNLIAEVVVPASSSSQQPPDEFSFETSYCTNEFGNLGRRTAPEPPQHDPAVRPNPESPLVRVDNPCLTQFASDVSKRGDCRSIALCVHAVEDHCQCGRGQRVEEDRQLSGASIDCGPDKVFDPTTGNCRPAGGQDGSPLGSPGKWSPPAPPNLFGSPLRNGPPPVPMASDPVAHSRSADSAR